MTGLLTTRKNNLKYTEMRGDQQTGWKCMKQTQTFIQQRIFYYVYAHHIASRKKRNLIQYRRGSNVAYEIHLLAMNINSKIYVYSDWIIDHKRTCNVKYTEITGEMERTEWKLNEINITNQKYMHYERHDGLV